MVILMDETIGAKGGHNDRKRSYLIKKRKKKKKEELYNDVKSLEKKVKKKQVYTLVRTLPIVIGGGVIQTIYDVSTGKKKIDKEIEYSKFIVNDNNDVNPFKGTKDEDRIDIGRKRTIILSGGKKIEISRNIEFENEKNKEDKSLDDIISKDKKIEKEIKSKNLVDKQISKKDNIDKLVDSDNRKAINHIDKVDVGSYSFLLGSDFVEKEDFSDLSFNTKEKLQKLKSRKIVEVYEKQLKDVRYELRELIYEYNVLCQDDEEAVLSDEVAIIIDKLSEIIVKVEELKSKINIDNLDKYDDQYIYYLIENYLDEFRNDRVIKSIKDSSLYILISNKLDEIDNEKDKFNKKLDEKREKFKNREENFEELQKKYYSIEKFNEDLISFQKEHCLTR